MSVRRVQLRRGTGAENNAFTGAVGELTVNTTNNSIRVHDGATLGGSETALANLANVVPTQNLDFDEYRIVNVADPIDAQDVATKNYVDSQNDLVNSLAELTDVDVAGVAPDEFLKYSGTEWINTTISTADLQDGLDIAMIDAGNITANLIGNADTATAWATAMTLNLTGTVLTGTVSFDGSATANLNASLNDTSISNAKLENSSVNIGAFTLSLGSTLNLSNDFQITGSTLSFAGGGGAPTSLEDLTDTNLGGYVGGQVLVYNPDNNKWENKSVVGDATLSATGTLILSAIENAKLVNSTINIGGSNIALGGTVTLNGGLAMTGSTLSVGNVATASALFSAVTLGIGGSVITGSVSFDGSQSVEIIADVTPLSITNGMIANATITNAKLEHDFIAFNNHEVHLGDEVTINGTEGEISVVANAGVYTIGLAGTLVADSAIALAKTIELAGNATGSVSLDNALGTVTLNVALGTITNAMLEHDFIAINDFQLQLGDNLDVVGADGITVTMDEPNSTMTIGLGTINTSNLSSNFITFADNDSSENIALGGTLTFLGVANETSVFVLGGEVNVGLAQDVEIQGNLTIGGSLIVNGTTTSINTVNLDVEDSIVLLGKGTNAIATAVNDAGFIIERGNTQQSASLFWDEGNSHFAVVTADSIGSTTTDIITQANNLAYADFKANSVIANLITGSTLSISADVQLTIDSEATFNENVNLTGNVTVQGDLYASNIIESANGLGITLQDTTSINANLDVYNPSGALLHGTTVYLYVKYGADSIANGEYFHIFKTNDNGIIRQVVPLTLLQDGGQDKLAVKPNGIYEYQAVAGAYNNAGNAPNASFVIDTEGGAYTYQIRAFTNNDDGVEFEVAFSTNGANPAPTYSILFNANDGSAYNSEYEITLDGALDPAVNDGAISTFNQTEKTLSVNSSTGDLSVEGNFTSYGLNVIDSNGNSIIATDEGDVNIRIRGADDTYDGFNIYGGVNGTDSFLKAQPNDNGGEGIVYLDGSLKVWNTNLNSFNVDRQANTSITGGDFTIEDTDSVQLLKLTNATGILEAREITSFAGGTLTLSGNIVATTQAQGDNSTALATTEYVDLAVSESSILPSSNTFTGTNEFQNDVLVSGANHTFEVSDGNNTVFLVNSNTGDTIITGVTTLKDNLSIINYTNTLVNGTTVYLYVKYGADSVANGEYFHIFKTNDGGTTREVVPLALLQDGGVNKLALKAGDLYEYQAVAGDYTNAGNVPNASFVLDTEDGAYTYQIKCYTSNDDGTEFEMALSLNGANPAPTYSILFTSNNGSAYDREYLLTYDSPLNIQGNAGATSTINQVSRILSANISTGDVTIHQGTLNVNEISALGAGTLILSGDVNLTGTAVTTTQIQGDNSTKLATTEYVDTAIAGVGGGNIGNFTFTNELIENTVDNAISVKASSYAQLESNNNFVYVQNDGVWIETSNPAVSEWHFDNDGHLTLPVGGLIKNNDGSTYLIGTNNTWTGGLNGFVGSGYFGGTLGTFSVIDATNTFNILNVDYTNSTVEVNSNSPNAFQVSNQGGGTQIFNIDGNIKTITLNANTTIQGGTLTFAVQDSGSLNVFTIDSNNGDTNISGDLIVTGDLTVNGQTTTINTTNMDVTDSLIELAHGTTGAPVNDAGFVIARGDEHNATLFWSEASDTFIFATSASINSLSTGNLLTLGGTLTYGSVRMGAISLVDDNATALDIKEGSNSYLKFDTTDGAEKIVVGKDLSLSTIKLTDNQASALDITEGANSYLKFVTTNSSEKVVFGKKIEAPADSVIADFTFQNGYITSPSNILINSQAGTTTFDDNVVVSGSFKLSQNTQEAEDNNVGVRFDYYDSSLINAPAMTTGQEYIIQSVGDTDFTLVGAVANSANVVFTVVGDASVLLAGTTGVVYPTASLTTGFFGHDKSSHVFTMYTDRTDENTIGNAKFNDLTLTSGLLIDMNGTDLIILNSAFVGIPTDNIGITVERGNYTDAKLIWDEGVNRWSVSNPDNSNNPVNPIPVITSTPGEGARYACYDTVFVADVYDIAAPTEYVNKTAFFLNNGGVAGSVNLFDVSTNAYDGYVLALFNTDTVIMTIDGFGGQTIGGDTTKDIPAGGCLTIMARNGAWYIM